MILVCIRVCVAGLAMYEYKIVSWWPVNDFVVFIATCGNTHAISVELSAKQYYVVHAALLSYKQGDFMISAHYR